MKVDDDQRYLDNDSENDDDYQYTDEYLKQLLREEEQLAHELNAAKNGLDGDQKQYDKLDKDIKSYENEMQKLEDHTHKKEKELEQLKERLQSQAEKNELSPSKKDQGKLIDQSDSDEDKKEIKNSSDDDGNKNNLSGTYLGSKNQDQNKSKGITSGKLPQNQKPKGAQSKDLGCGADCVIF